MKTASFLLETGWHVIGPDAKNTVPHREDSIEILQIWSDGGFFVAKNNIFPLKAGMLLIVDANNTHYSIPGNPQTYNRSKVILNSQYFRDLLRVCGMESVFAASIESGGHAFLLPPASAAASSIDQLLKAISHTPLARPDSTLHITSLLIQLLEILVSGPATEGDPQSTKTSDLMVQYVSSYLNGRRDIRMVDIAQALHISHSRAAHLFKTLYGKTLAQYTNELRIAEAQNLLLTTQLKTKDIAEILQFHSPTVFCKYFKQSTGCTPKQFRERGNI